MIKKILIPVLFLFSLVIYAQQGTSSPYSLFGIGDIKFKGTSEVRAMGGVSILSDSIHINLQNPASYSALKFTSFTVGGTFNATTFNTDSENGKAQRTTIDYFAVALPVGKFGVSFGLMPYSAVGYKIKSIETIDATNAGIKKYTGDGGVNKVYTGIGYRLAKGLSIGADVSYYFGKIETSTIQYITPADLGVQENKISYLKGLQVNIGVLFNQKVNAKYNFYSGITFSPQSNMNLSNENTLFSIKYSGDYSPLPVDFLDTQYNKTTIKMPSKLSVGAGFGQTKKWLLGTEITLTGSASFGNRFNASNVSYENGTRMSIGGFIIPNANSFSNYFQKMTYRAGFRYENTGLIINNQSVKDVAFTGGFGLPLGSAISNLNLGLEVGRRGTTAANLVQENYLNVIISLSLNDKWFVKSKYN